MLIIPKKEEVDQEQDKTHQQDLVEVRHWLEENDLDSDSDLGFDIFECNWSGTVTIWKMINSVSLSWNCVWENMSNVNVIPNYNFNSEKPGTIVIMQLGAGLI